MMESIDKLEKEFDSMRKLLIKLIKFPGNGYYKKIYKEQRISIAKHLKTLKSEVIELKNVSPYLAKLENNIQIFTEKAKYSDKKNKLEDLKDILDEMKIELYESLPDNITISPLLEKILGKNFEQDFKDLKLVYNRSGTCTAFLLRKILEKCIFYCFVKNDIVNKIEDEDSINKFVTLKSMIDIASREKIKNIPLLNPKTAKNLAGIKFLGDSSSHNFLCNVEIEEITPQMPYILTALKELANERS